MKLVIRKHVFLGPWARLNIFNSGFSVSLGHRSLGWITLGKRSVTESIDTGVSGVYLQDSQRWSDLRPSKRKLP
jgi:hypothetical protein